MVYDLDVILYLPSHGHIDIIWISLENGVRIAVITSRHVAGGLSRATPLSTTGISHLIAWGQKTAWFSFMRNHMLIDYPAALNSIGKQLKAADSRGVSSTKTVVHANMLPNKTQDIIMRHPSLTVSIRAALFHQHGLMSLC